MPLLARASPPQDRRSAAISEIGSTRFGGPRDASRRALVRALLSRIATRRTCAELESLLWCALQTSKGRDVDATDDVLARIAPAPRRSSLPPPRRDASPEEIRAAMEKHGGVHEKVWRELGLPNRHVLQRLLKKLGGKGAADDD